MIKGKYLLYKRDDEDKKVEVKSDGSFVYGRFESPENGIYFYIVKELPIVIIDFIKEGNNMLESLIDKK